MKNLPSPKRSLQLLSLSIALVWAALCPTTARAVTNPAVASDPYADLRPGDLVFIHEGGPLFGRIATTSNGWVSHVGIIVGQKKGVWQVGEGAVPFSRITPLDSFLARASQGQFAIKRFKSGLTPAQVARLNAAVHHRLGKVYDFGFNLDSSRSTFCSKFVYQVVQESNGRNLGEVETFRTLLVQNPQLPLWFWKIWFWGSIPWDRRTVTPESQFESPLLVTVCART